MSLSILETLENAQYNFKTNNEFQHKIAINQLDNAIILLNNGKSINDDFDEEELEKIKKG